jgi:hypothetical protein
MGTSLQNRLQWVYQALLSEETKEKGERLIIYIAIAGFLVHLLLYLLTSWGFIDLNDPSKLLKSPIAATYTPFSFILVYEVYLLVYYLPKSITTYIGKQYEIISLVIIRRLFKDLASLDLNSNWFENPDDLQFTYDLVASVLLFALIFLFNRLSVKRGLLQADNPEGVQLTTRKFIQLKQLLATILVPTLFILAIYSFGDWFHEHYLSVGNLVDSMKNINNIFFDEFFTTLILIDILLLLFSFIHTDQFHKVMRNSGFIISTILLRLSFGVEGLVNVVLIVSAVTLGVIILWIHNWYEKADLGVGE